MTSDDMRHVADVNRQYDKHDAAVQWDIAAEVCERLDRIGALLENLASPPVTIKPAITLARDEECFPESAPEAKETKLPPREDSAAIHEAWETGHAVGPSGAEYFHPLSASAPRCDFGPREDDGSPDMREMRRAVTARVEPVETEPAPRCDGNGLLYGVNGVDIIGDCPGCPACQGRK